MALWDAELFDWYPWRRLEELSRLADRLLGEATGALIGTPFPAVNVWADDEKAVVTAEVPGVKAEDLDISVESDVLTIRGSREPEKLQEGERYRRHERGHGQFTRSVSLPFAVDSDRVEARYKNGVLTVTLPRTEASKPKKIAIKG